MKTKLITKILKKFIPKNLKKNSFLRKTLALIASICFGFPGRKLILLGVTGTTGKTTTTLMIKSILEEAGIKTGLIGTAGYYLDDEVIYDQGQGPGTTPDPFFLHHLLRKMVQKKVKVVIIEVSSFGLMYWRTYGLRFQVAVLTNIAYNHHVALHGGMENYIKEKLKLFYYLSKNSIAVLPQESEYFNLFKANTQAKILTFGFNSNCDIWSPGSIIHCQDKTFDLKLKIPALFNVLNALAAIAAVSSLQISETQIKAGLEKIESIPGRLEMIKSQAPFKIIVDKANTPLAFRSLIDFLKNDYQPRRKIVVYGTFNESPLEEREMLAKLATDFFDLVIITEDDPKEESPQKGIEDFLNFAKKNNVPQNKYLAIANRREAIKKAIETAQADDLILISSEARKKDLSKTIILILGRGNEQFMFYKDKKVPFDDRIITKEILKEAGYLL
jgi:UDP-N-acetylmuramoyl-L-alanyl-D-glutamate--2,6-diaminopimelate ligase